MSEERLIGANALINFIDPGHLRSDRETCFSEADVVEMINKQPTIDAAPVIKWVSVEDRLPEEMIRILLRFTENRNRCDLPMEGTTCGFLMGNTFYTDSGRLTITHWMPLPEPPKEAAHAESRYPD